MWGTDNAAASFSVSSALQNTGCTAYKSINYTHHAVHGQQQGLAAAPAGGQGGRQGGLRHACACTVTLGCGGEGRQPKPGLRQWQRAEAEDGATAGAPHSQLFFFWQPRTAVPLSNVHCRSRVEPRAACVGPCALHMSAMSWPSNPAMPPTRPRTCGTPGVQRVLVHGPLILTLAHCSTAVAAAGQLAVAVAGASAVWQCATAGAVCKAGRQLHSRADCGGNCLHAVWLPAGRALAGRVEHPVLRLAQALLQLHAGGARAGQCRRYRCPVAQGHAGRPTAGCCGARCRRGRRQQHLRAMREGLRGSGRRWTGGCVTCRPDCLRCAGSPPTPGAYKGYSNRA